MTEQSQLHSLAAQLTDPLRTLLLKLPVQEAETVQEIRLRPEAPVCLIEAGGVFFLGAGGFSRSLPDGAFRLTRGDFEGLFQKLCGYSVHAVQASIAAGYLSLPGGHRVGVGGTAVRQDGAVKAVREVSCLSIRVAHAVPGCANGLLEETGNGARSLILAGPPGSGKTTLLRDLARLLGGAQAGFKKVLLCDERGELAAVSGGLPQFQVGENTDVLTAYPKSLAIEIAVRAFSPDYIILDEVAAPQEAKAIAFAVNCGVRFALSLHADSDQALRAKPILRELLATGEFPRVLLLSAAPAGLMAARFDAEELLD